jgi:hypothetical protein
MGNPNPIVVRTMPPEAIVQWSLTAMVRQEPVPLLATLDDGAPEAVLLAPDWPSDLRPPAQHNIGLLHQGSQWYSRGQGHTRYSVEIGAIKEACLHGYRAGLEGVAITGEASPQYTACELNYLALAHFCFRPQDSLRDFAYARLTPLVGSADDAEMFITFLAKRQSRCMSQKEEATLEDRLRAAEQEAGAGGNWDQFRRWRWLSAYGTNHTVDGTGSLLTP